MSGVRLTLRSGDNFFTMEVRHVRVLFKVSDRSVRRVGAVRADGDGLLIEGEVVLETPENTTPAYAEVQTLRYRRAFTLSRELDTTKSEAVFKDGVLKVRIPKAEHAQPRRIQVKVS